MAHPDGTSARAHRLIGLVAALLLAAATALAFGRVFIGGAATVKLLATAAASALLAVLFERRSLLLATVVSALGAAVAIGIAVFPDTTWYGVPTADTLRAALDAAEVVGEQARIQVAPAEAIGPLLLAAVISLWAAIFSAHALAFRAGSPLLGLIPPVALVAFADTVLEQFVKPLYGVAFLAAALLVVFADGLARVQGWGPVWSSSRHGVAANAGRGARRLGITALGAALVAPILVPGFGSKAVIDFGTPAEDPTAIDPFVSIHNALTRGDPVDVLRVTSPRPTYVRVQALPVFDGSGWRAEPDRAPSPLLPDGSVPAVEMPPDAASHVVRIEAIGGYSAWLPTPYPVTNIDLGGRTVRYDAATGTAHLDEPLPAGTTYEVEAVFTDVHASDLRSVTSDDLTSLSDISLPDLPEIEEIRAVAQEVTAGVEAPFDQAMAIQEHLNGFDYDPKANLGGGAGTILTFLTETQEGYCQQFATTMAVMLRTLGIPSRVVIGYAQGRDEAGQPDGTYVMDSHSAHSWVEVNFPGFGWMPFEPTPTLSNPTVAGYTVVDAVGPDEVPDPDAGEGSGAGSPQQVFDEAPPVVGPGGRPPRESGAGGPLLEEQGLSARMLLFLGAGAVAILLLVLVPPIRALRRRLRLRRAAAEPRRLILTTYDVFTERAGGLGLGRGPGETLDEYRRKVTDTGYLSDGHLDRLTAITTAAAYSPHEPGAHDAEDAIEAADTALREIKRSVGPARWFAGLYRRA